MKIKPIKQRDDSACGPTSIQMILNYFKIPYTFKEIAKVSGYKKKGGLYVRYHSEELTFLFVISEKTEKGDTYIRVRLPNISNTNPVEYFQDIISKVISIYDNQYESIVAFYRKYIPNFSKKVVSEQVEEVGDTLKNIEPDIFLPSYSRKCLNAPTIISDEEAKHTDLDVMVFPKEGEGKPRNYVCNHSKHKYPGLRVNPLENKDNYPYLPCCYIKNQADIPGSKYRHYYLNEPLQQKSLFQQNLFITNKIISKDLLGVLPTRILSALDIGNKNDKVTFVRKGVERNKSSFISCILDGLKAFIGNTEEEKRQSIQRLRLELVKIVNSSRQETFDMSIEEVSSILQNDDMYLDPRRFVHLFEVYFKCNIFIFTNEGLILPYHKQGYYKNSNKYNRFFYIYEHWGGEADNATYPQCELIVKWNTISADDITYSFTNEDASTKTNLTIFNKLNNYFVLKYGRITENYIPESIKIIAQQFDSFGKVRLIQVSYKGYNLSIKTTPFQPSSVKLMEQASFSPWSIVSQFIQEYKLQIVSQTLDPLSNLLKVNCLILGTNIEMNIFTSGQRLDGVPALVENSVQEPSLLRTYNKNKKLAFMLTDRLYWLYSFYLHKDNLTSFDNLSDFCKKFLIIGAMSEFKNNKIYVTSEEAVKRLIYSLRIYSLRHGQDLLAYYQNVNPKFYNDITAFQKVFSQTILEDPNSLQSWVKSKNLSFILSDSVLPDKKSPYFFKNKNVGVNTFLAVNTFDIQTSLDYGKTWFIKGYFSNELRCDDVQYTLYSYKSKTDIQTFIVPGIANSYGIHVIGYRYKNKPCFTVLMDINP